MSNKRRPTAPPNRDRVVIGYIHPGETSAYFTQSYANMLMFDVATSRRIVGSLNEWSSANISPARNSVVRQFLDDKDAEWLLFIDADMAWEHTALDQLLESADETDRPIVGGLCFGATHGVLFPTIYFLTEVDGKITTVRVHDYEPDTVVKCSATGAAFLLIHRRVLVEMRAREFNAAFPWFQETELSGQPAGEDITFCIRAGICGFPVHVNTGVKIGHHKSHLLTEELFQEQREGMT